MYTIDLNSDLGEGFGAYKMGADEEIIQYVTAANVACGWHAGDPMIMDRTVKMAKENFIGKAALEANEGQKRQRIGLKVTGRGIIREHQDVLLGGEKIGVTTSGTHCPYLGYPIAMALVSEGSTELGSKVEVEVRGRKVEAEVTALPFYKRSK